MNKYLEKIAMHPPAKHYARALVKVVQNSPLTVGFGVGGALDGAYSTGPRHPYERHDQYFLRRARDVIVGAGKGAAAGKITEYGLRHLKTQAIKDLEKAGNAEQTLVGAWREAGPLTRLSLGMSAGSLGIGSTNLALGQVRANRQGKTNEMAGKQLSVLHRIHRALKGGE